MAQRAEKEKPIPEVHSITSAIRIEYLKDHQHVIQTVARWIFNEWSFLYPGQTSKYVERLLRQRLHKKKLPLTLVAFKGRKPVGTVSLKSFDLDARLNLKPWITSLFVIEQARGEGVGTGLMHAIERQAADLGIKKAYLFTADSELADRFYVRKLNWVVREKIRYHSYFIIVMEKEFSASIRLDESRT